MDLISTLRVLWRRRWLALTGFLLAAIVAIGVAYRVEAGVPPRFESRAEQVGVASLGVLVDTPSSQVADLEPPIGGEQLNSRTLLYANLIAAAPLQADIAARAGIRRDQLVTSAPSALKPADEGTLPAEEGTFTLSVTTEPDLPIILVSTEAPDAEAARRLADATAGALQDYLAESQRRQRIPAYRRPVVSRLGPAASADVTRGSRGVAALAAGAFVLLVAGAAIVGGSVVARGWREAAEREAADGPTAAGRPGEPAKRPEGGLADASPQLVEDEPRTAAAARTLAS